MSESKTAQPSLKGPARGRPMQLVSMSGGSRDEQVQRTGIDNGGGGTDNVPALRQSEDFLLTNHVLFVSCLPCPVLPQLTWKNFQRRHLPLAPRPFLLLLDACPTPIPAKTTTPMMVIVA